LKQCIVRKHSESKWDKPEFFNFEVRDIENFTALEHCGGYFCSDATLNEATFRIYPKSSIPNDCLRSYETLIRYGNFMQ
jgi:hypothetical protein